MIEKQRVKRILTDLEGINEDLLNLYSDIQRNIDAHDPVSRAEGPRTLAEYNDKLSAFEVASSDLRTLIERITHLDMAGEAQRQVEAASHPTEETKGRIARLLDKTQPHTLTEQFTYTRPYGYKLAGLASLDVRTWRNLYHLVCIQLASIDPARFKTMPDAAPFRGRMTSQFTKAATDFRVALKLPLDLYCEGGISAQTVRDNLRRLLTYFSIPESDLIIYLRADLDAEEEEA